MINENVLSKEGNAISNKIKVKLFFCHTLHKEFAGVLEKRMISNDSLYEDKALTCVETRLKKVAQIFLKLL